MCLIVLAKVAFLLRASLFDCISRGVLLVTLMDGCSVGLIHSFIFSGFNCFGPYSLRPFAANGLLDVDTVCMPCTYREAWTRHTQYSGCVLLTLIVKTYMFSRSAEAIKRA